MEISKTTLLALLPIQKPSQINLQLPPESLSLDDIKINKNDTQIFMSTSMFV